MFAPGAGATESFPTDQAVPVEQPVEPVDDSIATPDGTTIALELGELEITHDITIDASALGAGITLSSYSNPSSKDRNC